MRAATVRLSAAGFSPWIVLDPYVRGFTVGLGVKFSSNGNLTCTVQHTFDDPFNVQACRITRVTTTASLVLTNHGLSVGDSVNVMGAGAPFDGVFAVVAVTDQNTVTYAVLNSGLTTANNSAGVVIYRVFPHIVLSAITVSYDGNYTSPPRACRLLVSAYTAGYVDLTVVHGGE